MSLVAAAKFRSVLLKRAAFGFALASSLPVLAYANGLGESVPYRFDNKDRVRMLEIQTLKESGFYDSQSGGAGSGSGSGDTIINGDQINCMVQSSALANSNASAMEALTGSLLGVSEAAQDANSSANDSEGWNSGDGGLEIGQENDGDQDSAIENSNINSDVGQFTGGGTSDQLVDTTQSADNARLTATIDDTTVCDGLTIN